MSLTFHHGVIYWLSTDAVNTDYIISGLPSRPKAIRCVMTPQTAVDLVSATISRRLCVGFGAEPSGSPVYGCVIGTSLDGLINADCSGAIHTNAIAAENNSGGSVTGRLTVPIFTHDGFWLRSADVPVNNFTVHWEAWCGDEITVAGIGTFDEPAGTGDVNYTATGFTAGATDQVVMFAGCQSTAAVNSSQGIASGVYLGFATGPASSEQCVVTGSSVEAAANTITDGYCQTGECVAIINQVGGDPNARATLQSFGTNLFTLTWLSRGTTGRKSLYMFLKGGQWKAGGYTIDGSTGSATASVTGLPFEPAGVLLLGRMSVQQAAGVADAQDRIGIGCAVHASSRFSVGVLDEDAVATGDINTVVQFDQALAFPSASGTLLSAYDISAINADGFTTVVDVAGGVASEWHGFLAFGPSVANLVAISTGKCSTTSALTTAIRLTSISSARCSISSALTTAIPLLASPSMDCSISASLSTISRFAALAKCHCSTFTISGDLVLTATGTCSTSATLSVTEIWQDVGFNFRGTIGFITDATKELGIVANFYPHTYSSDGTNVIAGWLGIGPPYFQNLNVSRDRRVAGAHAKPNDGTQAIFRIKVPQAGNWLISLAIGDAGVGTSYEYVQLFDNGSLIATYDHPAGTLPDRWIAADDLVYDETTWPSTGSTKTITHGFTDIGDGTAILTIVIGTPTLQADNTQLAHVRLRIAPDQGALLRGHATGTCSTRSIITVLLSADAHGICSTDATLGLKIAAMASAFCSTTRTNLLPNTEAIDNASWIKSDTTVTVDDALSPIGTMTADRLVENTANSTHYFYAQPLIPSGTNITWSIYAKAAGRTVISLGYQTPEISSAACLYNLMTGVATMFGEGTGVMTDVGNGWYRCSLSWLTRGSDPFLFSLMYDNVELYLGDGVSGVEYWGSQVEVMSSASPYYPVGATVQTTWTAFSTAITCAAVTTGACGVSAALTITPLTLAARAGASLSIPAHAATAMVAWAPSAVPDLAGYMLYRGTTPGGPYPVAVDLGFLKPNLLLQSNVFTDAAWTKEGSVIGVNAHATDDTLAASELIQTVSTGPHRLFQSVVGVSAGTYVASIYLKARAASLVTVRLFGDNFHSYAAEFDLAQGLVTPGSAESYPGTIAVITPLGDGWYRCSVAGALAAGPAALYAELNNSAHSGAYAGDATSSAFILRASLERGTALPAPYIGTTTIPLVGMLVTNLTPGKTYYVVATAYDASLNEGTPGAEVSKLIPYALTTAITPAAQATGIASTVTVLHIGGALFLAASATGTAGATAALLAPIQLAGSASGTCSTIGTLAFAAAAASFASASTGYCTTIAPITTAITFATDARGSAITIVRISVLPALMAAVSSAQCSVTASLIAAIGFESLSACTGATNLPALTTDITLAASATGSCSSTNALSVVGAIFAFATGTCSSSANLATTALLRTSVGITCSTVAALAFATGQRLASVATGMLSTQANIQVHITLAAHATGNCSTAATMTGSVQQPLIDNVQERWAERGIERGIFGGGG